ncbi:MAG: hypothetical protein J6W04_04295 [Bacteroidales bacterium]|nr:hypothetical protein [Bacteroidales bacterium]
MNTNTNTNINLAELISVLQQKLAEEEATYNGLVMPKTEAERQIFSIGYAEGIADVIAMLTNA